MVKRGLWFVADISRPVWLPALQVVGIVLSVIMSFVGSAMIFIVMAWIWLRTPKQEGAQ